MCFTRVGLVSWVSRMRRRLLPRAECLSTCCLFQLYCWYCGLPHAPTRLHAAVLPQSPIPAVCTVHSPHASGRCASAPSARGWDNRHNPYRYRTEGSVNGKQGGSKMPDPTERCHNRAKFLLRTCWKCTSYKSSRMRPVASILVSTPPSRPTRRSRFTPSVGCRMNRASTGRCFYADAPRRRHHEVRRSRGQNSIQTSMKSWARAWLSASSFRNVACCGIARRVT